MQSDDAVSPVEGTCAGAPDETHSRVCELEDKMKDLDNTAFTTKLKASHEAERQQQEEITSYEDQLVQALRAQVIIYNIVALLLNTLMQHVLLYMCTCANSHCQRPGNWNWRARLSRWKQRNMTWRLPLTN